MNWDAISAISQLIGSLAVVLSVLYLAVQVHQSTRVAKVAMQDAAATALRDVAPSYKTAHVQSIETELRQRFAARVEIKVKDKDRGQIVIGFDTNDEFERLVEALRK